MITCKERGLSDHLTSAVIKQTYGKGSTHVWECKTQALDSGWMFLLTSSPVESFLSSQSREVNDHNTVASRPGKGSSVGMLSKFQLLG